MNKEKKIEIPVLPAGPVGSRICAARLHKRYEADRLQRIRNIKPQIDATAPKVCGMKHLKVNFKRDEVLGCRYDQIERDNRHLLYKMSRLPQESAICSPPHSHSAPSLGGGDARFPGGPARRNEIARIESENAKMLKRLQNSQAEYRVKDWEAAHYKSRRIQTYLCKNPLAAAQIEAELKKMGGKRRSRPAASLAPLRSEGSVNLQDPSAVAPGFASSAKQPLHYVFREDVSLGGNNCFVEIATDGGVLAISAYDRQVGDTLEVLINEDVHQQLLHESSGDYGKIASRLRTHHDRLIILPLEAYTEEQSPSVIRDEGMASTAP